MRSLVLVASGGACGAVLRYMVTLLAPHLKPWMTLGVNTLGCLLIGLSVSVLSQREWWTASHQVFLVIGLLGGFTTYSSFALDAVRLWQEGPVLVPLLYVGLHFLLGFGAVLFGLWLGRMGSL